MDSSYDEFELDDAYDENEELDLEDEGEEDDGEAARRRRKRGRRVPLRALRPYALGTRGIGTAQITNNAGKTAQLRLPAPAVTVPEFRKAMSQVQRDVQGSARVIRELREELDRTQRSAKQMQKGAAWAANAGILVQLVEQVKDVLIDATAAHEATKVAEENEDTQAGPSTPGSGARPGTGASSGSGTADVIVAEARVEADAKAKWAKDAKGAADRARKAAVQATAAKASADAALQAAAGTPALPAATAAAKAAQEALDAANAARAQAEVGEQRAKGAADKASEKLEAAKKNAAAIAQAADTAAATLDLFKKATGLGRHLNGSA
jgi:hypothetical protein